MSLPNEFEEQLYRIFCDPKARAGSVPVRDMRDSILAAIVAQPLLSEPALLEALPGRLELAIAQGLLAHLEATFSPTRVEVREACAELKAAIEAVVAPPCCKKCRAPLSASERSANDRTPKGTHDRPGRQLCDDCWSDECESLSGPKGVAGPAGGIGPSGLAMVGDKGPELFKTGTYWDQLFVLFEGRAVGNDCAYGQHSASGAAWREAAAEVSKFLRSTPPVEEQQPWKAVIDWFQLRYGCNPDPDKTPEGYALKWALALRQQARAGAGKVSTSSLLVLGEEEEPRR